MLSKNLINVELLIAKECNIPLPPSFTTPTSAANSMKNLHAVEKGVNTRRPRCIRKKETGFKAKLNKTMCKRLVVDLDKRDSSFMSKSPSKQSCSPDKLVNNLNIKQALKSPESNSNKKVCKRVKTQDKLLAPSPYKRKLPR